MSNTKMKGRLKGLRYISQIFDNEKEPEMQIGNPTDVKHAAHIGWDGPSVNSAPSWKKEVRAKNTSSDVPKSSRRQTSSTTERSDRPKQKKSSKSSSSKDVTGEGEKPARRPKDSSTSSDLHGADVPKKSQRKKLKDGVGSMKSRNRQGKSTDQGEEIASKLDNSQSPELNHFKDG